MSVVLRCLVTREKDNDVEISNREVGDPRLECLDDV